MLKLQMRLALNSAPVDTCAASPCQPSNRLGGAAKVGHYFVPGVDQFYSQSLWFCGTNVASGVGGAYGSYNCHHGTVFPIDRSIRALLATYL